MQNNKLLLISLRDSFLDSDRIMPPLGIMSLHSYMIENSIDSTIENNFDFGNIEKYSDYTHFGISCTTPESQQAYKLVNLIKKKWPRKKVIIGGPHAKFYTKDCLDKNFDYIVIDDGEKALLKIMSNETNERVIHDFISEEELNLFPLPYREYTFLNQYNYDIQGLNASTILTAKGCYFSCAFCEDAQTKVRLYSPEIVAKQIDQIKTAGYKAIMFFDDVFAISIKRIKDLSKEILKKDIYYRCFGHAKTMTEEMVKYLSGSGCIETGFGAESGSQKILDNIDKKVMVEQNYKYVELCNHYGIKVKAFVMLGLPGENKETIKETSNFLNFLVSNKFKNFSGRDITNDFDLVIFFPYQGTKIKDNLPKYDLFLDNSSSHYGIYKGKNGYSEAIVRTVGLSSEELSSIKNQLYLEYKKRVLN